MQNRIKDLHAKLASHVLLYQFAKYFIVAFAGLFADFGTLILSREVLDLYYLVAATLGFCAGLVVVYVLSERFVFTAPKIQHKGLNFLIFGLIGLVGLGLLNLIMWILTDKLALHYLASKIAATVVIYCWNFFARRKLYEN